MANVNDAGPLRGSLGVQLSVEQLDPLLKMVGATAGDGRPAGAVGRRADRVARRRQRLCWSNGAGGPPVHGARGQSSALRCGAVCPSTAAASWPERTPTPAWGALAGLVAADRPPAALDRPAPGALWPRRHTADLDPRCAVVRRAPLATGPDCGGARPQWTTSGRSLLLHRPGP